MGMLVGIVALLVAAVVVLALSVWIAHDRLDSQRGLHRTLEREFVDFREEIQSWEDLETGEERILDRLAKIIRERNAAADVSKKVVAAVADATKS